jgi:hypothetical protein
VVQVVQGAVVVVPEQASQRVVQEQRVVLSGQQGQRVVQVVQGAVVMASGQFPQQGRQAQVVAAAPEQVPQQGQRVERVQGAVVAAAPGPRRHSR